MALNKVFRHHFWPQKVPEQVNDTFWGTVSCTVTSRGNFLILKDLNKTPTNLIKKISHKKQWYFVWYKSNQRGITKGTFLFLPIKNLGEGSPNPTCHGSCVTCHLSCVTCLVSLDFFSLFLFLFGHTEASLWRVFYQWATPSIFNQKSVYIFWGAGSETWSYWSLCQVYTPMKHVPLVDRNPVHPFS